jgi:putative methyltransferase
LTEFYPHVNEQIEWLKPVYIWHNINATDFSQVDVLALSCYVWNFETQMHLAKTFKSINPHGVVICGGPQISKNGGNDSNKNNYVDFWVFKEGEEPFSKILESLLTYGYEKTKQNRLAFEEPCPPPKISTLSPYLLNLYDQFVQDHANVPLTALWETTRGCPFKCSFCNWGSYTSSKVREVDLNRIEQEIKWFGQNKIWRLYITDANFGILNRDIEIAHKLAAVKQEYQSPKEVWANYNKNTNERVIKINDIFLENKMSYSGATISVQSLNEKTLESIGRENIGFNKYMNLSEQNQKKNVTSYTELIMGLPGETLETFKSGIDLLVSKKIRNIRMYPALVLNNTDFDKAEYRQAYKITDIERKLYLEQHHIFGKEIVEKARVISGTSSLTWKDNIELYKFAYITQALYCTGFSKVIYDELLQEKTKFSSFVQKFFSQRSNLVKEISLFIDDIVYKQFHTNETNMFGVQYRNFTYQDKEQTVRAAPWNLIWIILMLNKNEFFSILKEFIHQEYSIPMNLIDDVFSYQNFILLDLELWEKGEKNLELNSTILNKLGFPPEYTNFSYKAQYLSKTTNLVDYLYFSTGSTVITEFKYVMNQNDIIGSA